MRDITKMGKKGVFGLGGLNLVQNGVRGISKMEKKVDFGVNGMKRERKHSNEFSKDGNKL